MGVDLLHLWSQMGWFAKGVVVIMAIMSVYSVTVMITKLIQLCKKHKLFLIEDCAHQHGTFWKGQGVGSFGDAASFSFQEFLENFMNDNRMITSIGSLSLLANAILFTIYVNTHRDDTAKGIFIITLIYGIGILLLKIFN